MTRGAFIGRFQPFHDGHLSVVQRIAEEVDELVVGVGSAGKSHTTRNPFTAGERVMMLTKALANVDLVTYPVPLEDVNRNAVWVAHVRSMSPDFEVAYSNNPLVVRLLEEAGVEVRGVEMFDREVLEGTRIRERMIAGGDWRSLVPGAVEEVVDEVDGVGRIQRIARTDANDD